MKKHGLNTLRLCQCCGQMKASSDVVDGVCRLCKDTPPAVKKIPASRSPWSKVAPEIELYPDGLGKPSESPFAEVAESEVAGIYWTLRKQGLPPTEAKTKAADIARCYRS
jgi:hypothetical protein